MVITQRIVRPRRGNELARDDIGALVDQLIECMLTIGPRLAEQRRSRGIAHRLSVMTARFAIRFHVRLLKIGR